MENYQGNSLQAGARIGPESYPVNSQTDQLVQQLQVLVERIRSADSVLTRNADVIFGCIPQTTSKSSNDVVQPNTITHLIGNLQEVVASIENTISRFT